MAVLTDEQKMLQDAASNWVQERSPVTAFRRMRDSATALGYDVAAWAEMSEMGWAGVVIPDEYGGSDFGCQSMGLILEETGRTLAASPLLATGLAAASALVLGGSEAQKARWLPPIAAGEVIATLAIDEGPHHAPQLTAMRAEAAGSRYRLTGKKTFVLEGMAADLLIVAARTSGQPGDEHGIELFLAPADVAGLSRSRLQLADSRGVATLSFDGVELEADAKLEGGYGLLEKTLDRVRAGLAAEMLGASLQAFETTLDYLKTRVQFGKLIGSFQALQHRAARQLIHLELARTAVEAALAAIDADSAEAAELASLAKAMAGAASHLVTNEMVQMHGGIGVTDEHDAGLYLKRARVAEAAFGNQAYHRDRYARLKGY